MLTVVTISEQTNTMQDFCLTKWCLFLLAQLCLYKGDSSKRLKEINFFILTRLCHLIPGLGNRTNPIHINLNTYVKDCDYDYDSYNYPFSHDQSFKLLAANGTHFRNFMIEGDRKCSR